MFIRSSILSTIVFFDIKKKRVIIHSVHTSQELAWTLS